MKKCATSSISSTTISTISMWWPRGLAANSAFADRRQPAASLPDYLERRHGVRVLRGPNRATTILRRYDPHRASCTLNPYSPCPRRAISRSRCRSPHCRCEAEIDARRRSAPASARTKRWKSVKIGLQNYFAGALHPALPGRFSRRRRNCATISNCWPPASAPARAGLLIGCRRLQRPGLKGVPIFFARIDRAGNITKRHSAAKLQFARFGAACPLWNVHQAFETPGRIIRQLAETPDGVRYLCVATAAYKGRRRLQRAAAPLRHRARLRDLLRAATSSMPTDSISATAPPSTRSASPAASASAPTAPARRPALEKQAGGQPSSPWRPAVLNFLRRSMTPRSGVSIDRLISSTSLRRRAVA